jgi:hypothetical protein
LRWRRKQRRRVTRKRRRKRRCKRGEGGGEMGVLGSIHEVPNGELRYIQFHYHMKVLKHSTTVSTINPTQTTLISNLDICRQAIN